MGLPLKDVKLIMFRESPPTTVAMATLEVFGGLEDLDFSAA